jgi:hypothetical protein
MMQSYASAAKLRGGGPTLMIGVRSQDVDRVTATSDRYRQSVSKADSMPKSFAPARFELRVQVDGRSTTPAGTSPVVTMRHNAMSSLRASATIIVLRVVPRASAVRARYHCANPLSSGT